MSVAGSMAGVFSSLNASRMLGLHDISSLADNSRQAGNRPEYEDCPKCKQPAAVDCGDHQHVYCTTCCETSERQPE